ncbi:chemotaxis protein [Pseudomonas alcaligenes]|uniref:Chemotaxis protein n=1 Tax=Aquipseudomonas alcaligenes TaxID=43263 RepID=A0ABR7S035_AQUAC|nr:methyl-accepting chemotaxis protein [Pseudomonas alcaligenes]MBC9250956.1 chemotaxis protein [Pseudomonas alcaligenes]
MNLRNLNIGRRAGLAFALLTLITLALGSLSLLQMNRMGEMSAEVNGKWVASIIAVSDIGFSFARVRALTLRMLVLEGETARRETSQLINNAKSDLEAAESAYRALLVSGEERAAFDALAVAKVRFMEQQELVQDYVLQGKQDAARDIVTAKFNGLADQMNKAISVLAKSSKDGANYAAAQSDEVYRNSIRLIVIILLGAISATVFAAVVLTRSIVSPLSQAVEVARTVASGDLTKDITVHGQDEPAQLLQSLSEMQQSLRHTIQRIADSSNQLASASEELHAVTEDSTRGLHRQNSEIEQAATAVNEMTAAVEEVARNAVTTSEASQQTDQTAQNGHAQVRQTVDSINQLATDVTATSKEVGQLASNVRSISQVLNVIRSIAEQTNLLALNAAIEAARAGEQGRGFAVVADEVRALAHRTQQSTEEIDQMISGIQLGAEKTVGAMQNSMNRAQSTLQVAQAAGTALEDIARAIAQINERNLVIASASEEQAQVAREVDHNLVNIRDLAVQTAAGADQTSAASQELSRLAVDLNGMVANFKT